MIVDETQLPVRIVVTVANVEVCKLETTLKGPPGYELAEDYILEGVIKAAMLGAVPKMPIKNLPGLKKRIKERIDNKAERERRKKIKDQEDEMSRKLAEAKKIERMHDEA